MHARDILIALSVKYDGDWPHTMEAIRKREPVTEALVEEKEAMVKSKTLTIVDPLYPEGLKQSFRPPLVLYYYGDLKTLNEENSCLAYIGSRDASPYGLKMAERLSLAAAKEGLSVVTGLARGIDAAATKAALDYGGKAVAVLGSGIDCPYPSSSLGLYKRLISSGLVMSEYPGSLPPKRDNFPARNRIIAALCHGIVVGEASPHSGTLITVSYALGGNKEVGCVPYRADEESACNALIKDGAFMIENRDDLLDMIGRPKKSETPK
ncbi:MAG: DNA-protecting protein DprA [Bacilli bacterium]|nr:DNA-protecting protein DprA [Bacilli bacterium]